MKGFFSFFREIAKIVIIALIIVIPIRYLVFQPFFVKGQSMEPNFEDGDYLIVDELSYKFGEPERGDVVVFKYPNDPSQRYIKRIIGLPGERVEVSNGSVVIFNDQGSEILVESGYLPSVFTPGTVSLTLGEDEYFVMGDNRAASSDSRRWGPLTEDEIVGKVYLRAWPLASFSIIGSPDY